MDERMNAPGALDDRLLPLRTLLAIGVGPAALDPGAGAYARVG